MNKVCVIGAGAWGSALAQGASLAGNSVTLVARNAVIAEEINTHHINQKYLGQQSLNEAIVAACDLGALEQAELVILALPAQITRSFLQQIPAGLKRDIPVVVTAKGFEAHSLALQSEIVADEWAHGIPVVLSGPSFAVDVAGNKPTAVTLACKDSHVLSKVMSSLSSHALRPYSSMDVTGVQLCGGLKNVYALASGAIEGAGLGLSARSAFVARALNEMSNIVASLKGEKSSVLGLAGIGDLMLSCTSEQSRNYRFGIELGGKKDVKEILSMGLGLAEGVATAPVALALARRGGLEAPLVASVNDLLNKTMGVAEIVSQLMQRRLKSEGK